jgi:hypothetical protein
MKAFRWAILTVCVAASGAWLGGCGNGLDDGSEPSGSIIDVVDVTPNPTGAFTPDIYVSVCDVDDTGKITYEDGLTNSYANVQMVNNNRPTTPSGESTNSYVTMSRYRVDFTGLNKSVSIPSIDGGGQTVGIEPGSSGTMTVLVLDFATMEYIRSHYPAVGNPESLTLRATITIWGKDAFQADVQAIAQATLVIDNYDRCSSTSGT